MAQTDTGDLQARLAALSPERRALLEQMLAGQTADAPTLVQPGTGNERTLSFSDSVCGSSISSSPRTRFTTFPLAARLRGPLNEGAFWDSLNVVVQRHEALRAHYDVAEGQPLRRVAGEVRIQPACVDLRQDTGVLNSQMREESRRPFRLSETPLLRCTLYRVADEEHVALLVMHHIVCDGWSMAVMLRELAVAYDARVRGEHVALPPLPIQYPDFAAWQRQRLDDHTLDQQIEYWRERLETAPRLLELPTDHPRPAVQDFAGAIVPFAFPPGTGERLRQFAHQHEATPFDGFVGRRRRAADPLYRPARLVYRHGYGEPQNASAGAVDWVFREHAGHARVQSDGDPDFAD